MTASLTVLSRGPRYTGQGKHFNINPTLGKYYHFFDCSSTLLFKWCKAQSFAYN